MTIQQMREARNELARQIRHLLDSRKGQQWTAENQKTYDESLAKISDMDAAIEREEKALQLLAESNAADAGVKVHDIAGGKPQTPEQLANAITAKWLRGGDNAISAQEWQAIRATMSTTTGSEGGYTVPTTVARNVVEALMAYGGMRAVAEVLVTEAGSDMNFPTSDGTAEEGELVAQNASASDADAVFGTVPLVVYKYSSKVITVPIELLADSSVDVEAFVRARLATRLGRITNKHFTIGTGTGQPTGIVTASAAGKVGTTGQTTTVIYDDLVDLEHSVDLAYRDGGNCAWMMNDSSAKVIRKIKDTAGRPLWLPSYDAGIRGKSPEELAGYRLVKNQHMAAMAANAKSILFGDFSHYKIRDTLQLQLQRFTDSAFAKKGQVGFLAWYRGGGNFVGVSGAQCPVKHYQNPAT